MCLGLPGRLVARDGEAGVLEVQGRRIDVNLAFTPDAAIGSWILAHSGVAVRVVQAAEAATAWELIDEAHAARRSGPAD